MTRFARAKGSKASNEKAPEDSTPWEVMKEQLLQAKKNSEEAKKREEAEKQRIENYENFLKEHKIQKRKATWCEFPEAENNKQKSSQQSEPPTKKNKSKKKQSKEIVEPTPTNKVLTESNVTSSPSKKSKKKRQNETNTEQSALSIEEQGNLPKQEELSQNVTVVTKSCKNKLKKKKQVAVESENVQDQNNESPAPKLNKKNKNKKNKKQKNGPDNSENENNDISENPEDSTNTSAPNQNGTLNKKSKKDKKLVNGVPVRRKPINDRSFQLIINGKDVELVRFDGFPIMKKDAERLEELKNNMIKKGIPKSEVNRTLKLERRRAEKALARLKRDVCYNCRKGGHNLSDCPELKTKIPGVGAAEGVCFKCGSTEHRQFECKVQKDKEFRFATCFICKEPGHIARQCPDNPKGLYPNGGGCKLCGDVTHLRKDCPTVTDKKEGSSIKLQTLDSAENLEGIDQVLNNNKPQETTKKVKKIKF